MIIKSAFIVELSERCALSRAKARVQVEEKEEGKRITPTHHGVIQTLDFPHHHILSLLLYFLFLVLIKCLSLSNTSNHPLFSIQFE